MMIDDLPRMGTDYHLLVVGGFKQFLFSIVYGMSSFPLTNSYFSRWLLHHQPDTVNPGFGTPQIVMICYFNGTPIDYPLLVCFNQI